MREIDAAIERARAELADLQAQADEISAQPLQPVEIPSKQETKEEISYSPAALREWLLHHTSATQKEAAQFFGISETKLSREVKEIDICKNGDGWKVKENA